MITGFTNHALIVFPDEEVFEGRSHSYNGKLLKTTQVLREYLNLCEITMDCFATDSVAVDQHVRVDRWIGTLGQGDMFFVKNNCEGVYTDTANIINNNEVILEAAAKFPIERGAGFDTRFEQVLKEMLKPSDLSQRNTDYLSCLLLLKRCLSNISINPEPCV